MKILVIGLWLALSILLFVSCSNDGTPTTGGTGDNPVTSEPVALTGILNHLAGPLGSPVSFSPEAVISDYKIIAQALGTKRIYVITTASDGSFEFTVPADDSYTFHILDEAYHYVAPIVMAEYDPDTSEVPEAVEVDTNDVDLGNIVVSGSDHVAVLAFDDQIVIDSTMIATAINGIPVGAGDQGTSTGGKTGSTLDQDGDGVIDIMDSDDDGDGILDEFDTNWHKEEALSTAVDGIGLFINFNNHLDSLGNLPTVPDDGLYIITIDVRIDSGYEDKIVDIVVAGPTYLDQFLIEPEGSLATNWETYNQKILLEDYCVAFSDKRYGAFLRGISTAHIWQVVSPGDVWLFEITYDDGGTEYTELLARKINFLFEETPSNVTINDSVWTQNRMTGLPDTVVIRWDIIASLPGMYYKVEGWPIVSGHEYGDMFQLAAGIDGDSVVFVFEDTVEAGDTIEGYSIDVVASNPNNDNAKTRGGHIAR